MDGGESSSLYWSGTYVAPQKASDDYTWDSNNDRTRTDMSLFASGDDKKTFSYKDGELSYEVTAMGETATIVLIPTAKDYMSMRTVTESADTTNLEEVKLTESQYYVSQKDGKINVYYLVGISNPNEEYAIKFPQIIITARDENGKILKTETMTLSGIAAGDEYPYANNIYYEGVAPSTVDISVENDDDDYLAQSSSGIVYANDLPVTNMSAAFDSYGIKFTGEVTNSSTQELSNVSILVFYYSGEVGEIEGTYIDDLEPGETKPFETSAYTDFDSIDGYIIWAIQW